MMNGTWKKIQDPQEWPELKKLKYTKNCFIPNVFDSSFTNKQGKKFLVQWDRNTKEFFIFC